MNIIYGATTLYFILYLLCLYILIDWSQHIFVIWELICCNITCRCIDQLCNAVDQCCTGKFNGRRTIDDTCCIRFSIQRPFILIIFFRCIYLADTFRLQSNSLCCLCRYNRTHSCRITGFDRSAQCLRFQVCRPCAWNTFLRLRSNGKSKLACKPSILVPHIRRNVFSTFNLFLNLLR